MRQFLGLGGVVFLAACAGAPNRAIQGTIHSNVLDLRSGMSSAEVVAVIGAFQDESYDPSWGGAACRSYVYDETIDAKYVHALFIEDALVAARDGYDGFCRYGGDVVEAGTPGASGLLVDLGNERRAARQGG